MFRNKVGMRPTVADRLGIRIARLIVANRILLARTCLALAGYPANFPQGYRLPWSLAEVRAIIGACAYANAQWLASVTPEEFGVDTEATKAKRRLAFAVMSESCGDRMDLPLQRRPVNGLNVEIGQPISRCRQRTPENWGTFDPRGARWLASGGDAMILGSCNRAQCPRLRNGIA
jgi:hypothetical protein